MISKEVLYGIAGVDRLVGVVPRDGSVQLFFKREDGTLREETIPYQYWVLLNKNVKNAGKLTGGYYQYLLEKPSFEETVETRRNSRKHGFDAFGVYDAKENIFIRKGMGMYQGMTLNELSVLSFDLETTGTSLDETSKILLISNTFRDSNGKITKKLFAFDDFDNQAHMLNAWAYWVRTVNPDIILGHNVFAFDFPYLIHCAKQAKIKLKLGRTSHDIKVADYDSKFRRDGSQFYSYRNIEITGREIVDTFFLSIKYDIARNFPSYGLKPIMKYLKLEKEDRQHYDASQIRFTYQDPVEWKKIKKYAEDDADDALSLFDLMIPAYFYYAQHIPKSFQSIINSATGSQLNSFFCRAYLQMARGLPKASEAEHFAGGLSFGNPGIYENVYKIDVASMYPSIIIANDIKLGDKDPMGLFADTVRHFTSERLKNKQLGKTNKYNKDLSEAQKIVINSMYGFLGSTGLLFNYPEGAAEVTRTGRSILENVIKWAEDRSYSIVNADTDSFSYTGTSDPIGDLNAINELSPKGIVWEDDGRYDSVVVVKAKNYLLRQGSKITIKGSALKATMKESALRNFVSDILTDISYNRPNMILNRYNQLVSEIKYLKDIGPWCSKKTITSAVLNPKRTNEEKVWLAIQGKEVQEGDKIHLFFKSDDSLCLKENFDGDYSVSKLLEKLHKTVKILESVLDMRQFLNFKLKRNQKALELI